MNGMAGAEPASAVKFVLDIGEEEWLHAGIEERILLALRKLSYMCSERYEVY